MEADAGRQQAVFEFMQRPQTHGLAAPIARVDTHGAALFLAGENVYKIKRAVRFPFMDFSTLEKRRRACEAELEVNRHTAPGLYLGVVAIRLENGRLRLGGDGDVVEWAVHLRRFDETRTLDRLAERGELTEAIAAELARSVALAHFSAPPATGRNATAALRAQLEETAQAIEGARDVFPAAESAALASGLSGAFAAVEPLLLRREAAGWVRRCHGDLHLRNIVMIDGRPVLFDALEFDESFATSDVLYDLAFLLTDLWTRGLAGPANLVMNGWFSGAGAGSPRDGGPEAQLPGLAALPLFLCLRAAIRARVTALEPDVDAAKIARARGLFDQARRFLTPDAPRLVAVGGRSGTGKTRLARRLAPHVGPAPGAVHLRSDVERKRLFGVAELAPLAKEAYRPEVSPRVYRRLNELASLALAAGRGVIIDAAFLKAQEREEAREAARASPAGASFAGLWLEAPLATRVSRVAARDGDASDAGPEVALAQEEYSVGEIDWTRLDASQPLESLARAAREVVAPR